MASRRVVLLCSFIAAGRLAVADPRETGWGVTPLVGTAIGLDLAAGLQVETPVRVRLMGTIGWTPRTYAWLVKQAYLTRDESREALGSLIQEIAEHALDLSANLTFCPMPHHGLFVGAGYRVQIAHEDGLFAGQLENAIGMRLPASDRSTPSRRFDLDSHVHLAEAMLGWQWGVGAGFMLRASLGVLIVASTSTEFEPAFEPADPTATRAFTDAVSDAVEDASTGTVAPSASVYVGYTF